MKLKAIMTTDTCPTRETGRQDEFINIELFVHGKQVGEVELYLNDDSKEGMETDEWTLQYRPDEEADWDMIAQGNLTK